MKKKRILWITVAALVLALVIGCAVYVGDYYRADSTALEALQGSAEVLVRQEDGMVVFQPQAPVAGFIFYPGGKVEYTAYAPLMLALAEQDILCVILQMPLNLAVLDVNAAAGIPEAFPEVSRWYIGGHSLGGSMAASYAAEHTDVFAGLVLLASYSTEKITGMDVLSICGSEDGVLNWEKKEAYRGNLPQETVELIIDGGNHALFGSYGPQDGDGQASISAQQQIRQTVAAFLAFLEQ